jgi:putative ABC transport system permease protein
MDSFWQDTRYALRKLRKNPGFTTVAVLTLTLGIGANTAIFSVVNGVLLRPLPYKNSRQLVRIWATNPKMGGPRMAVSWPNFRDWKESNHVFEKMTLLRRWGFTWTDGKEAIKLTAILVPPGFFTSFLGVQPALGRDFEAGEDEPGRDQVAILSHALWRGRFAGDPSALGKTIRLDKKSYTIIGVMGPDFRWQHDPSIWTPLSLTSFSYLDQRGARNFEALARLQLGISVEQAQVEMDILVAQLQQEYRNANSGWTVRVVGMQEDLIGGYRTGLLLLGAVGLVLLIACVNVANLLLAQAGERQREMAIRVAVGATRIRLGQQLLTESLLLSCVGGFFGVVLAHWGIQAFLALSPGDIPRLGEVRLSGEILVFTLCVSAATGFLFGLVPVLTVGRLDLQTALKEGTRNLTAGRGRGRLRGALVIVEMALAIILLTGAGLLVNSFVRLVNVHPGFNTENLLIFSIGLPTDKYASRQERNYAFQTMIQNIESIEGVAAVEMVNTLPLSGFNASASFIPVAGGPGIAKDTIHVDTRVISPGYFSAIGIPFLEGRSFVEGDTRSSTPVIIVNEALARHFWPGQSAVGEKAARGPAGKPWEIVGVVRNIKHKGLDSLDRFEVYRAFGQNPSSRMTFVVRTTDEPEKLAAAVRGQVRSFDRDLPIEYQATMEELLWKSVARPRFNMSLLGVFASLAVLLSAVGLYGVISYSVSQRTHEIGVRMALGAQPRDIFKLVVGQGMLLTLIGVSVGLAASFALTRLLKSLLFGVAPTDAVTFVGVAVLLTGVALLACYIPARRATKVDPMVALRTE